MSELSNLLDAYALGFVVVLCRVGCAAMLLPGIGEAELPLSARTAIALALTVLLLPVVQPGIGAVPSHLHDLAAVLFGEIAVGLWMGWLVRITVQVLPVAGQLLASMMGLTNIIAPDAELGGQSSALSHAFALAAPLLVLAGDLHELPLRALAHSYEIIVPGAPLPEGDAIAVAIAALGLAFDAVLRLAGPFVLAGVLWQVCLSLLSRLVPQLQVYFAAMPGQVAGGLLLLASLGGGILNGWLEHARAAFLQIAAL